MNAPIPERWQETYLWAGAESSVEVRRAIERIADLEALLATKQSALSEAHREIAERQRLLDEAIGQIEYLKASNQTLLTALDRTAQALGYAFSKKPLRDMAETLAEARAAIAQATKEA